MIISKPLVKCSVTSSPIPPSGHTDIHYISFLANPKHLPFMEVRESSISKSSSELHPEEEDLDISWSELVT